MLGNNLTRMPAYGTARINIFVDTVDGIKLQYLS
jgi:hypothetical protein